MQEAARARSSASAARSAARASAAAPSASRWSATPTPASRRCSTRWSRPRAYAADQLFATLDTTTRQLYLERRRAVGVAVRHGRLHPRPAAQAGRGLPGHAAGGRRRRPAAARGRRGEPGAGTSRCAEVERVLRRDRRRRACRRSLVFNKLDRARRDRSGRAPAATSIERRRRAACRASSSARRTGEGLAALRDRARAAVAAARRAMTPSRRAPLHDAAALIGTIRAD